MRMTDREYAEFIFTYFLPSQIMPLIAFRGQSSRSHWLHVHSCGLFLWMRYLRHAWRDFLQIWHNCKLGLMNWIDFGAHRSKVQVTVTLCSSNSCSLFVRMWYVKIWNALNFFKFATIVHMVFTTNCLDFSDQRSEVKVTWCSSNSCWECDDLRMPWGNFFKSGHWTRFI